LRSKQITVADALEKIADFQRQMRDKLKEDPGMLLGKKERPRNAKTESDKVGASTGSNSGNKSGGGNSTKNPLAD
jgi:hypothetical protein